VSAPGYYTRRRLSPFLGTLQIVQVDDARAYSTDGVSWELRLRSEQPISARVWGNIGPRAQARRWFRVGRWSPRDGLKRVPTNPDLGDPTAHPALDPLQRALEAMPPRPFPQRDTLELWLLDRVTGDPFALLASCHPEEPVPDQVALDWQATARTDIQFPAPCLQGLAEQRPAGVLLNEFVRQRRSGAQWFRRTPDGAGTGLVPVKAPKGLAGRQLSACRFPVLPLTRDWRNEMACALVSDYLSWLAPMLLTLAGLPEETRGPLERAAAKQALLLDRLFQVIPEFVDRKRIQVALVEAAIRRST
jgi:hypothetical protein